MKRSEILAQIAGNVQKTGKEAFPITTVGVAFVDLFLREARKG
jgi:hypothetical protein